MTTTAFVNAAIFDGHHHLGTPGTVVVEDGHIRAVGDVDPPSGSVLVDVAGGLLCPGFVDAHVHAVQGGLERIRCDLSDAGTREEYLAAIKLYAERNPHVPWILGGGWAMAAFPGGTPTAADLDSSCLTDRCSCPTATTTGPG